MIPLYLLLSVVCAVNAWYWHRKAKRHQQINRIFQRLGVNYERE